MNNICVVSDILSLKNSSKLKILRRTLADDKSSTTLDDACQVSHFPKFVTILIILVTRTYRLQIYLSLGCDTVNIEESSTDRPGEHNFDFQSNRDSVDILRDSSQSPISKFSVSNGDWQRAYM